MQDDLVARSKINIKTCGSGLRPAGGVEAGNEQTENEPIRRDINGSDGTPEELPGVN